MENYSLILKSWASPHNMHNMDIFVCQIVTSILLARSANGPPYTKLTTHAYKNSRGGKWKITP